MAIVIRRLEEQDEVEGSDCADEPLNNYLKRHAWTNQEKSSIGVTYVAVDEGAAQSVLGYFTLAMASVPRDAFPKKHVRGLPLYDLPLSLPARLAVDGRFAGRGLGHALISEAFRISRASARRWVAAASSRTHTGTGSVGIRVMVLCLSKVLWRVGHKGCFLTYGQSARPSGAESVKPYHSPGRRLTPGIQENGERRF